MTDLFESLLKKLQLQFKDETLLRQSFIHRSYLNEYHGNLQSNERLEFLGDSVLSLVVSNYIYSKRTEDAEGDLTNLRAYIVKTKSLAEAAKELGLGDYLKLSKGEGLSGGQNNPQLLANTYEALIGAIYLDQGLEEVKRVIGTTLLPLFEREIKSGPPKDSKSYLQELVQEKFKESPKYKILKTMGPDHAKEFMVGVYIENKLYGEGTGFSKQDAEEISAKKALQKLKAS